MASHTSEFCLPGGEKPPDQFTIWKFKTRLPLLSTVRASFVLPDVNQSNTVTDLDLTRLAIFITGGVHVKATD